MEEMGRSEPCVLFAQSFVHSQLDEYVDEVSVSLFCFPFCHLSRFWVFVDFGFNFMSILNVVRSDAFVQYLINLKAFNLFEALIALCYSFVYLYFQSLGRSLLHSNKAKM